MRRSLLQLHPKRLDIPVLLVSSTATLWFGLHLPTLTVRQLWEKNTFTILTGIESLYADKQHFLAFIVFFFSIIFPIAKLITLFTIWFIPMRAEFRKKILYGMAMLGKWSMLDVFIVAVLIVSVKLGALASANAEKGIYFFGASVLLAMAAAALEERLVRKNA